jgi:ABC-type antimicrobial peptide transport system permease subunit
MALGAARLTIVRLVVAEAVRILLLGAVPGLVMASLLGRLIRSLLYGVGGTDWVSLSIGPALLLMAVGLLAAVRPALHAASVDPAQALRSE